MNKIFREGIFILLTLLPLAVLGYYWSDLPEQIPTQVNMQGDPTNYTPLTVFLWIVIGVNVGMYFLLLFVPAIDPKKQVRKMGDKYDILRGIVHGLLSVVFTGVVLNSAIGLEMNELVTPSVLIFFIVLGNYLPSVQPNYFIGVRTPWTLENPEIWKIVHRWAGRLWVFGGTVLLITYFLIDKQYSEVILISGIIPLAIIPVVQSYILFTRIKENGN